MRRQHSTTRCLSSPERGGGWPSACVSGRQAAATIPASQEERWPLPLIFLISRLRLRSIYKSPTLHPFLTWWLQHRSGSPPLLLVASVAPLSLSLSLLLQLQHVEQQEKKGGTEQARRSPHDTPKEPSPRNCVSHASADAAPAVVAATDLRDTSAETYSTARCPTCMGWKWFSMRAASTMLR